MQFHVLPEIFLFKLPFVHHLLKCIEGDCFIFYYGKDIRPEFPRRDRYIDYGEAGFGSFLLDIIHKSYFPVLVGCSYRSAFHVGLFAAQDSWNVAFQKLYTFIHSCSEFGAVSGRESECQRIPWILHISNVHNVSQLIGSRVHTFKNFLYSCFTPGSRYSCYKHVVPY